MIAVYLETSALLAWLLGEPRGGSIREAVDSADVVVTSALTFVETERALLRAVSERLVTEADAHRLRGLVEQTRGGWIAMAVTDEVLARAGRAFPVEPVRTLDGIHLATALAFTRAFQDLRLIALDRRVLDNAESLGLRKS